MRSSAAASIVADAQGRSADRTPVADSVVVTDYDPVSVMNYCGAANGRDPTDTSVTRLDLLGMEILYQGALTGWTYPTGCDQGCLYTSDGVLVRTDGSLTTDWTARGAHDVVMTCGAVTGRAVPATAIPSGTSVFGHTFKVASWNAPNDPRAATRSGGGNATKSDEMHTAVLTSILSAGMM